MKINRYARSASFKTVVVIVLMTLLSVLLTSCGKPGTFDGSKVSDEDGFRMEYTILDREETAGLSLSEGDLLQVIISHIAGDVDVTVGQEGKEPIYRGTGQKNAEFILTVPETGRYRISIAGHQAKGTVSIIKQEESAK